MGISTAATAAIVAERHPLYLTPEEKETVAAGLRAAWKLMSALSGEALDAQMRDTAKLLEESADDYQALARRIERGELDQVPS